MKILITGGLGFLGSNLAVMCLEKGHSVTILSKTLLKIDSISNIKNKVDLIIKDVKDIDKEVEGFDIIYHFAGTTNNYHILDNSKIDVDVNCHGTISLLDACKKYNSKVRIVLGSTFFVHGNPSKLPVTPEMKCNPLGLYGVTKLAAEHFCKIYNKVFGLNCVIVRFTNVFGVGEQRFSKKKAGFNFLINLAIEEKEIPLYDNGDFYRDYIFVDDAIIGTMTVAEKGETGKIYFVGRGEFIKFKDLIDIVIREVGSGKIRSVEPPLFHKQVGIKDFVCDNGPLKKLGWKPKVTLKEGIKRTIEAYKNE